MSKIFLFREKNSSKWFWRLFFSIILFGIYIVAMLWWKKEKTNYEKIKEFVLENKVLVACGVVGIVWLCKPSNWKRIPDVDSIPVSYWKKRKTITGVVSRVGDGDGFHLYHRPLLHSFIPLPRPLPSKQISVRIAGVDAPECAHFGIPGQAFGEEAKKFLQDELVGKTVAVQILKRDQYGRCVGMAWVKRRFKWENVSSLMLKKGLATVYIGSGAEYGNLLKTFQHLEKVAKFNKVGMWGKRSSHKETPMEFKKRTKAS